MITDDDLAAASLSLEAVFSGKTGVALVHDPAAGEIHAVSFGTADSNVIEAMCRSFVLAADEQATVVDRIERPTEQ